MFLHLKLVHNKALRPWQVGNFSIFNSRLYWDDLKQKWIVCLRAIVYCSICHQHCMHSQFSCVHIEPHEKKRGFCLNDITTLYMYFCSASDGQWECWCYTWNVDHNWIYFSVLYSDLVKFLWNNYVKKMAFSNDPTATSLFSCKLCLK